VTQASDDWRTVLEFDDDARPTLIQLAARVQAFINSTASADGRERYLAAHKAAKQELGL